MEERELIQNIQSGEPEAFRRLYDAFQDHVYNTAMGFLHNSEDAQDITQDVFIELFRSFSSFRGDSRLSTWVYRITVNKSLNLLRKKRPSLMHRVFGTGPGPLPDPTDPQPDPSQTIENKELRLQLTRAIDALPEKQRTAFILDKFEDLSYKEIANVMELSLPAVESLLFRARRQLQRSLLSTRSSS